MKKIILIPILIFSFGFFGNTNALEYEAESAVKYPEGDGHHTIVDPMNSAVGKYLSGLENASDIDKDEIAKIVKDVVNKIGQVSSEETSKLVRMEDGVLTVGCGNGDISSFKIKGGAGGAGKSESTTTVSASPSGRTYISGYTENISPCAIFGSWKDLEVKCIQTITYIPRYSSCGNDITTTVTKADGASTSTTKKATCPLDRPAPKSYNIKRKIKLQYINHNCTNMLADGKSRCHINFELQDAPGEGLSGFTGKQAKNISFPKGYLDQTDSSNNSGDSGIVFGSASIDFNNKLKIPLTSIVPLTNVNGDLTFDMQGENNQTSKLTQNLNLTIKKPVSITDLAITGVKDKNGKFILDESGKKIKTKPEIGLDQEYNIQLKKTGDLHLDGGVTLDLKEGNIVISDADSKGNSFVKIETNILNIKTDFISSSVILGGAFSLLFDVEKETRENIFARAKVGLDEKIAISYKVKTAISKLQNKKVKYYLDKFDGIEGCQKETLGLKVVGGIQYNGKGDITGQAGKYTDLSSTAIRDSIREKAYALTLNREKTTNQIINGVYYNTGNTTYSTIPNLKGGNTIIIKDGNLIVDENIDKKIGIIVIGKKDNANIYIDKDVTSINAVIYADGSLLSVDANGNKYNDSDLYKSLDIKGSIFTRNTVGGAVAGEGSGKTYYLPGQGATGDFKKAEKYDLNFLRKADLCPSGSYSLKVEYDPYFQLYPPKGFQK